MNTEGNRNTGNWNTGDWNAGHSNTGDSNTGNWNTGHSNTGDRNTGDSNTGHSNTGDCNAGHRNTGDRNTGNGNTGNGNTGDWNTGHCNTGDCNTGDCNTGDWNTGDWNTGFFCTETPAPNFFDVPCGMPWDEARGAIPWVDLPVGAEWVPLAEMTDAQKQEFPNHATIGGCLIARELPLREAFPQAWAKLDDATKQRFVDLPNFDAEKFLAITGVDVRETSPAVPSEVVVDGRRYVLAD